ncbi:MAG: hypothetical protein U1F34_05170 [Gammaproteobacteria bacterium]
MLTVFIVTFVATRVMVFLIMSRRIPDLYIYVGATHVHHLNFGIFLLAIAGAALLFAPHASARLRSIAIIYAIGLALTFDEFGMWLHLGGDYWQRASFDAVTVIGGLLALVAFMPPIWRWSQRRWMGMVAVLCFVGIFFLMLIDSLHHVEGDLMPKFDEIEKSAPP